MKKKIWIGVAVVLVIGAAFGIRYLLSVRQYREQVASVVYAHADASGVPDGTFFGEFDTALVGAKVEVQVQDGKFTEINILEHRHDRGATAEKVIDDILAEQRIDVDAVSGATNSSIILKKAVDNALSSAQGVER